MNEPWQSRDAAKPVWYEWGIIVFALRIQQNAFVSLPMLVESMTSGEKRQAMEWVGFSALLFSCGLYYRHEEWNGTPAHRARRTSSRHPLEAVGEGRLSDNGRPPRPTRQRIDSMFAKF